MITRYRRDPAALALVEALLALLLLAAGVLPLFSSQMSSVSRTRRERVEELTGALVDVVMLRFGRAQDRIDGFLRPDPLEPARLVGESPWGWSPELAAGLPPRDLEELIRGHGLTVRVVLSRCDRPGLARLEVTGSFDLPGPGGSQRREVRRVRMYLAQAGH